jgi:hypothetical protein
LPSPAVVALTKRICMAPCIRTLGTCSSLLLRASTTGPLKPVSNARTGRPITARSRFFDPDGPLKRPLNARADRHPPRRTRPMLAHPTPRIFVPIRSPDQTLATSLSFPLPSATPAHLRRIPAFSGMAGSVSESFTSRSVDPELIPRGPEEMAVRLALRRTQEEARGRLRSNSIRRESIASAQMAM